MELFNLSEAMTDPDGIETGLKALVYLETRTPLEVEDQRTVSPSAERAICPPVTLSAAP